MIISLRLTYQLEKVNNSFHTCANAEVNCGSNKKFENVLFEMNHTCMSPCPVVFMQFLHTHKKGIMEDKCRFQI